MESIAMLNGIPTQLDRYLTSQAKSVVMASDYNMNLAGLGAVEAIPGQPVVSASSGPGMGIVNPVRQRGGWVRRNLQEGLSKRAGATLMGAPTTALSVSEQVRAGSIASQQFANRLAGIPESPAEAARAARAGNIVSQQYNPNLAGLGEVSVNVETPAGGAKASLTEKALWAVGGAAVAYAVFKLARR